jgi:hypothetical protein
MIEKRWWVKDFVDETRKRLTSIEKYMDEIINALGLCEPEDDEELSLTDRIESLEERVKILEGNNYKISTVRKEKPINEMEIGEYGYAVSWALKIVFRNKKSQWYINGNYPVHGNKLGTVIVKIERTVEGYRAYLPRTDWWGNPYSKKWNQTLIVGEDDIPITVFSNGKIRFNTIQESGGV